MEPSRRIAHLDMDAFYASVELLRYPELKGQAVVVGGRGSQAPVLQADGAHVFARLRDYVGRGVLTTSTYEARALGVFSGMGTMKAARLAPDAVILPVDFESYRHYSQRFKAAVAAIAPAIEDRGIDEIYIDLSTIQEDSLTLAKRIKAAVWEATGLTCSIGITPNKLLSKISSDLEKPDGITILDWQDIPARIWPLPAKKINGIGPKAAEKLAALGIGTIGELADTAPEALQQHFGYNFAAWLHDAAHGIDTRPVATHSEPKSISRETTFDRDLHAKQDKSSLSEIFTSLCTHVSQDLKRQGYQGRTIGIKLRYDDFQTVTRDYGLPRPTDNPALIRKAAGECLKRVALEKRIRLLGVRIGNLSQAGVPELTDEHCQTELPF
jgi:DNA polymerase-4